MGTDGTVELNRALTAAETSALKARAQNCADALVPFHASEADRVGMALAGLFAALQVWTDAPDAQVNLFRQLLREFPAWAIEETCFAIARGDLKLESKRPTGPELVEACRQATRLYHAARDDAQMLLKATVAPHRGGAGALKRPPRGKTTPQIENRSSEAAR